MFCHADQSNDKNIFDSPVLTIFVCSNDDYFTAQKIKFSIKDLFRKCDQIRSFLRVWSHFLKKSLMKNFILCAVLITSYYFQVFWYVIKLELKLRTL